MKRIKHIITVAVIGLAMLAQLMSPTLVHADGETTPPPAETLTETPTPEPTEAPTETATESPTEATPEPAITEAAPTDVAATAEPVETSTPEPAVEATAVSTEPAVAPTESVETTVSEVMQELSDQTSVVVLDENGEVLPLASQDTADVIAQADPIWCPEGIAPNPGVDGCTGSYTTMQELLLAEGANINSQSVPGRIWITEGIVPDVTPIVIDGATYTNWANQALTLQGGWTGLFGDTAVVSNSAFSQPLTIANWNNTVGIANISAPAINVNDTSGVVILADVESDDTKIKNQTGRIDIYNSKGNLTIDSANINNGGLYSAGINVHGFAGTVTISNSQFHGNGYDGVWMNNVDNVTVTGSDFFQNSYRGLSITANNDVRILDSSFYENGFAGLDVTSYGGNVTLSQLTAFSNYGTGLSASAAGTISANDIQSTNNINGGGGCPLSCGNGVFFSGNSGVQLSGTNAFVGNGWTAVDAWSSGDIALSNVTATGNQGYGSYLITWSGQVNLSGANTFSNHPYHGSYITGGNGVNVTGTSTFNNNGWNGLAIDNSGAVTLNNVTTNNNQWNGIAISSATGDVNMSNITSTSTDTSGDGAYITTSGNVTLTGTNDFSNHSPWNSGMFILAGGNVSLSGLKSNNNGRGVNISQAANVTVTNATFENNGWDGGFDGLFIQKAEDITLNNVHTNNNNVGAQLSEVGNVKITGGSFTNNDIGLYVICAQSLTFNLPLATFTLNLTDILVDPTCPIEITKEELPVITVLETQVEGEQFVLDCAKARSRFVVHLANGDRGDINCPVVGNATITRVDNTTLPANLPAGYTYASGFNMNIQRENEDVIVISEGGYVTASFIAASNQLQPGNSYSILYWDPVGSTWVPLKDYLLNEYRNTQVFDLFPGVDDNRKILSGVKYFTEAGEERGEVSTNFPGIFVLAQH
jgi:hypothetical protein